ncbi:hypothetical protein SDC9_187099 [bioreactor metagenome]|uniref:Uncharacterized protein n=1 Tax=bioreactor metagenome TaxID=1076179 RepID=A0A645HKP2_9ZZZZ
MIGTGRTELVDAVMHVVGPRQRGVQALPFAHVARIGREDMLAVA